ncbi:MAG: hypothetical protein N2712_04435 [Brevinematales bacterium]|nr:hypothetical protein [Brevinematales bacterium]
MKNFVRFFLLTLFSYTVFLSSCQQVPTYKDTVPPNIIIFSPMNFYLHYSTIYIHVQVNELNEYGKVSGIKSVEIVLERYYNEEVFRKKFEVNSNEFIFKSNFSLHVSTNIDTYRFKVFSEDNEGNRSYKYVEFWLSQTPLLFVDIYSPPNISTNTNRLGFSGVIRISTNVYGNVEWVKLVVSNSYGVFSNDVDYFNDSYWKFHPKSLSLEEDSFSGNSNRVYVVLKTTLSYYSISRESWICYDTNLPFVNIINLDDYQSVPKNLLVIVSNYDNSRMIEGRIYVISGVSTNIFNDVSWIYRSGTRGYNLIFSSNTNILIPYERDEAGNEYYGSPITVIYNPVIPSISLLLPTVDYSSRITNKNKVVFNGRASVELPYRITNVVIEVYTNNVFVYSVSRSYNNSSVEWSFTNILYMGTNQVRYYAFSDSGKISRTNYVNMVVDYVSPIFNLIYPTNGSTFDVDVVNLVVEIIDTNFSLGIWGGYVYVNGVYWGNIVSNFGIVSVPLSRGVNYIVVGAQDFAGNIAVRTNTIIYNDDVVYVSYSGSDYNTGSKNRPLRSIQAGINKAVQLGLRKVYVSEGIYSPGYGLNGYGSGVVITNHNLIIIGGWDTDFSSISSYSELDGYYILYNIIFAKDVTNLVLGNFVTKNGRAVGVSPYGSGGGIYFTNVSFSVLSNIVISNNNGRFGSGLCLYDSHNNIIYSTIMSNLALNYGGGIYFERSYSNRIGGVILGNISGNNGGGVYMIASRYNIIQSYVGGNWATNGGGGIYLNNSDSNIIKANIKNNFANGVGGALYISDSKDVILSDSFIVGNGSISTTNTVVYLNNTGNIVNLVISNCFIGGNNDMDSIGIYEGGSVDTVGHVLRDNVFITNNLRYLYREYSYLGVQRLITNTSTDWHRINNPSIIDASLTHNSVTNM